MALRRKKGYKFSDEVMSKDAIISLIFGVIALLVIIFSIILAIILKGAVPEQIGALLLASGIMAVTALIFALISLNDSEGGILSKRGAIIISVIDLIILVVLYLI
ncbi:MAG: hypothetical protein J6I58_09225 [Eubacterium sp.]|nr:hypothetical protein [Eubacterium sp.]MBR1772664.1 hypothetical protein [Eubacterium sp.]